MMRVAMLFALMVAPFVGCLFPSQSDDTRSRRPAPPAVDASVPAQVVNAPDASDGAPTRDECSVPWAFYVDEDGDGWGAGEALRRCPVAYGGAPAGFSGYAGDCDDRDPHAFPGQAQFFAVPRTNGGFDYDCDGTEERQATAVGYCYGYVGAGGCHYQPGWANAAPGCGASGATLNGCAEPGRLYDPCVGVASSEPVAQACR